MKYTLGDLTVRRWNDWDRVPRMPQAAAAYVTGFATFSAASAAGAGLSYALVYAGAYLGFTAVTSWAINALSPKPDLGSLTSRGILVNAKDPAAPADFVYGTVRKGGVITYYESTGETNKYLHQIIVLAAHEVNSIGDIYINDTVVTLDGSGFVTSDGWDSKIRIQKFDGSQTTAPADLLSESELTGDDALTSNFIGNGLAYLYVRYEYDQDVFANGLPLITAVVQGKKVYDPRTASTAYSNNAALCIRDFLTAEYGLNDSAIDDVAFSAAANECDEQVLLASFLGTGVYENRYTINGIVRADRAVGSVLGDMMAACAGTLFWGSGYWKLKAGAYSSPVKTLTLDDLRSSISLDTRITLRDNFNEVQGTFNDGAQDYITVDYPKLTSTAFLNEDGGVGNETALDLQLPFTTSSSMAQRLAKLTLFRGREQMTLTAEFGMNAFDIEVGDIIAFTNDRYGWDEKEFEVIGWRLAANQDAGDLRVALTLRETSAAAFDWNAEETEIIGNNTNLPVYTAGLTISNLSANDGGNTQGDGTFVNTGLLSWDAVDNAYTERYEVQWKLTSDSTYSTTFTTNNSIEISPLVDGVEYTFRVRAITANGYRGPFASVTLTAGGDTTAPALPTSISATGEYKYIVIEWTSPADVDFSHVEVWENDTDTTSGATKVGTSSGDSFMRPNLGLNVTKYYFLKSVDYSGNTSGFTASVNATTEYLGDDFVDGVVNLFLDQGAGAIPYGATFPASPSNGDLFFLTTDGQLYEYNATDTRWELQAEAGSIVASDKIVANSITGGLIAASGVITDTAQINNGVIQNANIGNLQVDTIKIADNAVTVPYSFTTNNSTTTHTFNVPENNTPVLITAVITNVAAAQFSGSNYASVRMNIDGVGQGVPSYQQTFTGGTLLTTFTIAKNVTLNSGNHTISYTFGSGVTYTNGTSETVTSVLVVRK
jgi:hypothetical protein